MMAKILVLILCCLHLTNIDSARILAVFPTPSISHQIVFRSLIEELVKRDHQVTVITPDPGYPQGQTPPNLKEIDVHNISYSLWRQELKESSFGSENDLYAQINNILRLISRIFKSQLQTKEVNDIINKKTGEYDLLFTEAFVKPALIFSHVFKIPVIQISSMGPMDFNLKTVGAPTHPLLYPTQLHQRLYNLTKWEKIREVYKHIWFERYLEQIQREDDVMLKTLFGSNTPSIKELFDNVHMLFLDVHPIWMDNQPVPPSVVYIGGIHVKPSKELPKDLQNYLDSSKNGVIYFSLGTNVVPSVLPLEKIQMFLKVFSEIPYDVMWKWDKVEFPRKSANVKIFNWVPQSDLLKHTKIKLFITQGGLQSTDEAIQAGVPLIGIPMLGDQWYNVEKYVRHKIGLRLDLDSLTESKFKNAVQTVIEDKSFRENIVRLRTLMEDQPQTSLERAVWWTEHVLRHGGAKHLRAAGANISWSEYIEFEIILIIATLIIVILIFICIGIRLFLNLIKSNIKIKVN